MSSLWLREAASIASRVLSLDDFELESSMAFVFELMVDDLAYGEKL